MGNPDSPYHLPRLVPLERILQRHLMVSTQYGRQQLPFQKLGDTLDLPSAWQKHRSWGKTVRFLTGFRHQDPNSYIDDEGG